MTRPTARVLALLEILQSGGTRTLGDLADRLGVDERTVRRYVGHLADLDIPVESVRGRYGGVRLVPGFRLPPLMLTDDEALAVLLGLVAGRRAGLVTTSAVAVESAAAKLRRVLPRSLGRRLDALLETADFTVRPQTVSTPETAILLEIGEAARERRPVRIDHTGSSGRRTCRTLHPYGIVAHAGRWYVTGADSASGEVRTFRMDRIAALETLAGAFQVPDDFDPAEVLLSAIAGAPHRHTVSVSVEGSLDEVRPLFPRGVATVRAAADPGHVDVVISAERLDWLPVMLARIDRPFRIVGPDELRPLVRALADRLAAATEVTGQGGPDGGAAGGCA